MTLTWKYSPCFPLELLLKEWFFFCEIIFPEPSFLRVFNTRKEVTTSLQSLTLSVISVHRKGTVYTYKFFCHFLQGRKFVISNSLSCTLLKSDLLLRVRIVRCIRDGTRNKNVTSSVPTRPSPHYQASLRWLNTCCSELSWRLRSFNTSLSLALLNPDMSCFCKQCRSRSAGFWRSQLIWICTVCH